jgi:hypothetical protein
MSGDFSSTAEVFGGKIRRLPGGRFMAISYFQFEAEQFLTFVEAEKWLLLRMDFALAGGLGGTIRQLSDGSFVAVSYFQKESSIHASLQNAEEWLLEQKELAQSVS